MNLQFINNINETQHDAFVQQHPLSDLLQSSNWAKVKNNWSHEILAVKEDGNIVASSLVLSRQTILGYSIFYLPRGPIMDYNNIELVNFFMSHLRQYAKAKKGIYITMDPGIIHREELFHQFTSAKETDETCVLQTLQQQGCKFKGYTKDFASTIQSRYHAGLYSNEDWENNLKKRAKKALTTAQNKHIKIQYYGIEGVEAFAQVVHCTEQRKQIHLRDEAYFRNIMKAYGDDAVITLAHLPIDEVLIDIEQQSQKLTKKIAKILNLEDAARKDMQHQLDALAKKYTILKEDQQRYGDSIVIAGSLSVKFGNTAEILYAGMNDRYKRYMAPYCVFYHSFKWAFNHGCTWCNMGGIEGTLDGGLVEFKSSFQPTIREYIGEFDMILHPFLYRCLHIAMQIRKWLR